MIIMNDTNLGCYEFNHISAQHNWTAEDVAYTEPKQSILARLFHKDTETEVSYSHRSVSVG